uniref:Candidate secreted effector n=1 Tax=Meloidogyne incognita TaxID=6306 RepID=A0A914KHH9_MELIC
MCLISTSFSVFQLTLIPPHTLQILHGYCLLYFNTKSAAASASWIWTCNCLTCSSRDLRRASIFIECSCSSCNCSTARAASANARLALKFYRPWASSRSISACLRARTALSSAVLHSSNSAASAETLR